MLTPQKNATPQEVRPSWLRKRELRAEDLRSVTVTDDSMGRTVPQEAVALIDVSQTEIDDGKIYYVFYAGLARFKRIYQRPRGLMLHSDNDDDYPAINLTPDETEAVQILGRLISYSVDF